MKLIKYFQNKDKISTIPQDGLNIGKGYGNPSLNTVAKHWNHFRLSLD